MISDDFPLPDGPHRTTFSPEAMLKLICLRAKVGLDLLLN